jgi:hypothetical protein
LICGPHYHKFVKGPLLPALDQEFDLCRNDFLKLDAEEKKLYTCTMPAAPQAQGHHAGACVVAEDLDCDVCGMFPLVGPRYHKIGEDWDLCRRDFQSLNDEERGLYNRVEDPHKPLLDPHTVNQELVDLAYRIFRSHPPTITQLAIHSSRLTLGDVSREALLCQIEAEEGGILLGKANGDPRGELGGQGTSGAATDRSDEDLLLGGSSTSTGSPEPGDEEPGETVIDMATQGTQAILASQPPVGDDNSLSSRLCCRHWESVKARGGKAWYQEVARDLDHMAKVVFPILYACGVILIMAPVWI